MKNTAQQENTSTAYIRGLKNNLQKWEKHNGE